MIEFLAAYGLFLIKFITIIILILLFIMVFVGLVHSHQQHPPDGKLWVTNLNNRLEAHTQQLQQMQWGEKQYKTHLKRQKKKHKQQQKAISDQSHRVLYVIDFKGDIKADATACLREEISAVLCAASPQDEVLVRLESAGGLVHAYGLAAAQLDRIRQKGLRLTVCVDQIAASGGYMMACVADHLVAAPFAVMGSVGVAAHLPNFHRLLKKNDIDMEYHTAGAYKRTLTMVGENTREGRQKFLQDLEHTHTLFKKFVSTHRPQVDIQKIATGEIWYGSDALQQQLIDEIATSDDYLLRQINEEVKVLQVVFKVKKSLSEHLGMRAWMRSLPNFHHLWRLMERRKSG